MDSLPEKITDIADEEVLTGFLVKMSKCEPRYPYTIKNGFIYFSDPYFNGEGQLLLIQTADIEKMYKEYKQSTGTSRININFKRIGQQQENYLMFNNTFNLITADMQIRIIDNLIFCTGDSLSYIVQTNTGYYCVSGFLQGVIRPYTPVKFNYKINLLKKVNGEQMFMLANNIDRAIIYRHVIDPYEACDALFMCADTYDIVNVETGERIPTWPLVYKNIVSSSLLGVQDELNSIGCICPEIDNSCLPIRSALTFYDSKWNIHYLRINFGEFQELRQISSGKATKAAASVAAAEVE